MSEIYDYKQQAYLKSVIRTLPRNQQDQLKSIRLCNVNTIKQPRATEGVYLLRSNQHNHAKLFGQVTCKNPWACPCCTPKIMSKYASDIGATIDAMRARGYFGFMMTFTVAHLPFMSCREVTDILYNTWGYCFKNMKKTKRTHGSREFQNFYDHFKLEHRVRVCEYTYGENGWHPHFHCIFWVKKEHKDEILEWQDRLNAYWEKYALIYTKKYWEKNELHSEKREEFTKAITSCYDRQKFTTSTALKISTDKDGKILEALTSDYICGWGSEKELTGNVMKEASHKDHLTPYQILELAVQGNKKYEQVYIDFLLQVTRKPVHHRVDYSQSGLRHITTLYKNTQGYKEVLRKKKESLETWTVLGFFEPLHWWNVCQRNLESPFISNILWLAANAPQLLDDFLRSFKIKLSPPEKSNVTQHIENIWNGLAA